MLGYPPRKMRDAETETNTEPGGKETDEGEKTRLYLVQAN